MLRPRAAIFGHLPFKKRTVEICLGAAAAALILEFYFVRELIFLEAIFALSFAIIALIVGALALGYVGLVWCGNLFPCLRLVRTEQPETSFAEPSTTALLSTEEEVS